MTEPSAPPLVPGPVRPGPVRPVPVRPVPGPAVPPADDATEDGDRFAGLADLPPAEHVAVFEAEHDRLQSELGTIDRV